MSASDKLFSLSLFSLLFALCQFLSIGSTGLMEEVYFLEVHALDIPEALYIHVKNTMYLKITKLVLHFKFLQYSISIKIKEITSRSIKLLPCIPFFI